MKSFTSRRKASSSEEKERSMLFSLSPGLLARGADRFVMADHFLDDEGQELFREIGIELGVLGQRAQPGDLHLLACGIGGRKAVRGLILAHRLGAFEALGQEMDQRRIDIVDTVPQPVKLGM